jgi:hypothetical protein
MAIKRNVEKTKQFLQALVALSIDIDKTLQTIGTIRLTLKEIGGGGGGGGDEGEINEFLQLVDDEIGRLREERKKNDTIRCKGETIVYKRQTISPYLKSPVEDLELSNGATGCIPIGVETLGNLCQYRPSEIKSPARRYINEIRDMLRTLYGLVLKPDEK